jgi:iron complex transport system substrate-binding protein
MRVVSLVPAATEIVAALGGADRLVGISHECDYPPAIGHLPRVTSTPIDRTRPGPAIDAEVRRLHEAGRPVFLVDAEELRRLAPDLLLTQGLCEVCAVADGVVHRLAAALDPPPAVLSLDARDVPGIWRDIQRVGAAIDLADEAEELVIGLEFRLRRLRAQGTAVAPNRRHVLCVEWLEPPYLAGHWMPELVAAAGGVAVGAEPGSHSRQFTWDEAAHWSPDLIVVMLCGFDVERSRREIAALGAGAARDFLRRLPTWIVDGNAYTSRPGPRVVDGAERLQAALLDRATRGDVGDAFGLARWQE